MELVEFEDCLDRFGSNLGKWPEFERGLAESLLVQSAAARELLNESERLQGFLSRPSVSAPSGLADRIFAQVQKSEAVNRAPVRLERRGAWAEIGRMFSLDTRAFLVPFFTGCFIFGICIGFFGNSQREEDVSLDLQSYVTQLVDHAHDAY